MNSELADLIGATTNLAAVAAPFDFAALADENAVMSFSQAMRAKMAVSRGRGRGGWQGCAVDDLWAMLREHVEKGDPVDVANLAMMIWYNQKRDAVNG